MDSKDIFGGLLSRLVQQSVFYLPNEEVRDEIREILNVPLESIMGELKYVSAKDQIKPLLIKKHFKKILLKKHILDDNIFDIVDLKDDLSKGKFKFIIDKYFLWISAICSYSESMLDDIYFYFPNLNEDEYLIFNMQFHSFIEHRNNIIEICKLKNVLPYSFDDAIRLIDSGGLDFKLRTGYDLSIEKIYVPPIENPDETNREGLINEHDIEQLLLESVFNIKHP